MAATDRAVVVAEQDIARYSAEFSKLGPGRNANVRRLRKLLELTRKRLDAASSKGAPRWTKPMARLRKLRAAMEARVAGKKQPPAMFLSAGEHKVQPNVSKEITVARAPIHLGADASTKVVGEVVRGDKPLIIGKPHKGWHKIARAGVVEGWVHETAFSAAAKTPPLPGDVRRAQGGEPSPATKPLLDLAYGAFHALVIGNNDYKHLPKLKTAVADAREVKRVLSDDYGFAVTLLEKATRSDILRAVNKLRADLGPEDNLLIYYAGHGTLDRESDTGYWLPIDAEPDNDVDWIANAALTRHLKAMNANHVLVVADSCYSGTLFRDAGADLAKRGAREAWLKRMNEKRSRTAIASGGLEPVADSGGGRHSVFAKAFLGALADNDGVLDDQELYRRISRPVILEADQTPRFSDIRKSGHEGGAFLFVPSR